MRIPGAGNKAFQMLESNADYLIHVVQGIKYWDMCAAEALMRARFAIVTDKDQQPIIYDHTRDNFTIMNGFIFARNQAIYDLAYDRIKDYLEGLKMQKGVIWGYMPRGGLE